MASSWMARHNRSSKGRNFQDEYYKLDPDKSDPQNVYDIVAQLADDTTNEPKRLCLLNALAKVFKRHQEEELSAAAPSSLPDPPFGFTVRELLQVISVHLYHQFTQIRASALRALRHLLRGPDDLALFNALQLPDLVCRSLDIILKNDEERAQALKLIRRMLIVEPQLIVPSVVRCLVSLSEGGAESGDRMLRSCLAVLCEFGVLHPKLLICCGGVSAITRNVLEFLSPRIAESLCGVLLHLLEWPETRSIAGVRLDCLAAPYCDFTYRAGIMDKNKDARDLRFTCSRLALLSILRSWSGIIEFCDPSRASGLKAIVDILYLNQLEVRKAILDLLYELLGIPQPVWTDEFSVALATIDPSDFQDAWRLSEGFVAAEGRSILPTLAKAGPNVCEIHTAMLLYCFLESGLLEALVEVIVSSDTFISVRATVLLGKLTHLMHRLLPPDICAASAALPTLIGYATKNNHQATAAIAALQAYHQVLKNRPASCSLFLDCIVRSGEVVRSRAFQREINTKESHVPLQANGRPVQPYHRINSQELAGQSDSALSTAEMSSRAFMSELKKRRRHNSSGSNSIDMTINELMNSSTQTAAAGAASGAPAVPAVNIVAPSTTKGGGGGGGGGAIPQLKRTGSIKLNKFFQIFDPLSQTGPFVNFLVDNRDVVHLNTDKELIDRLIRDSEVLTMKESSNWDWEIVVLIFKTNLLFFLQRMDDVQLKFLRRIIDYFKPSNNRFSHQDLMLGRMVAMNVHAGVELVDWYMRMALVLEFLVQKPPTAALNVTPRHLAMIQTQFHGDCVKFLKEFAADLNCHLELILTSRSAHDCLFSPQHMMSTMCQQYFLLLGRFCQNDFGVQILTRSGIFGTLERIVATTNHICYIKLIVTALDYSQPCAEQTRRILELGLKESKVLAGRLYATQFLLVLMRAKIANFQKWGIRLLVDQATRAKDKSICLAAMEILEEACHEEAYLLELIELWPEFSADMCGDAAVLLQSHFYSQLSGLEHKRAQTQEAITMWERRGYCKRYVLLVEAETHASLTLHSKNEDGTYCRRSFSTRPVVVPPNVLPHLYGQLARTRAGCGALKEHCDLRRHLDVILANKCASEENVLDLKASLYAIGNIMTSELGVELLKAFERFERVVQSIMEFVKFNEVYSVRATSLNVLGLIGSTQVGANALYEMDWLCVRHNRNTMWPVCDQEELEFVHNMTLWANSKHMHEERLAWPPYNFNALSDLDGSSPRPLASSLAGATGTEESDTVDGLTKCGSTSMQSMNVSPRMASSTGGGSVTSSSDAGGGAATTVKSPKHHVRSLSESKTTEGLHMWREPGQGATTGGIVGGGGAGNGGAHPNVGLGLMFLGSRQRINSGTDSNTSGVSSCDSTYGRNNIIYDLQQTLSPIPSTSDLRNIVGYRKSSKPNIEKYNRWCEEQFRKISLAGLPVRDIKINPLDLHGYAKIRHIKRNQRPMLSESAAEDLIKIGNISLLDDERDDEDRDDDDDVGNGGEEYRLFGSSVWQQQQQSTARNLKVRSLDRQQQANIITLQNILKIRESSELSVQSSESLTSLSSKVINTATPPPVEDLLEISSDLADYRTDDGEAVDTNRPCYMGICLPRNILNLFPRRSSNRPYVAVDLDGENLMSSPSVIVGAGLAASPSAVQSPVCGLDEVDHVLVTASGSNTTGSGPLPSAGAMTSPTQEPMTKLCLNCSRTTTTTTSTANNATKTSSSSSSNSNSNHHSSSSRIITGGLSKHHKKLIMLRNYTDSKRTAKGSAAGASGTDGVSEEDLTLLAILMNVQRCANPVLMKQAKLNLLELKQKHGEYFQDLCLYSEVLKAVGRNTYRQTSRRFLQELFLDIDFEEMLKEAINILNLKERQPPPPSAIKPAKTNEEQRSNVTTNTLAMDEIKVDLRNGNAALTARSNCQKINEEADEVDCSRKSLPVIVSPARSNTSGGGGGEGSVNGGSSAAVSKGLFSRVQLSCTVNKFPVKRDRANSLNTPSTTAKDY